MRSTTSFVRTRRSMRLADTLYVFEQRNGLFGIVEEHGRGAPKRTVYSNQSRRTAEHAIAEAVRDGQPVIVWGTLRVPIAAAPNDDLPLFAVERGAASKPH